MHIRTCFVRDSGLVRVTISYGGEEYYELKYSRRFTTELLCAKEKHGLRKFAAPIRYRG